MHECHVSCFKTLFCSRNKVYLPETQTGFCWAPHFKFFLIGHFYCDWLTCNDELACRSAWGVSNSKCSKYSCRCLSCFLCELELFLRKHLYFHFKIPYGPNNHDDVSLVIGFICILIHISAHKIRRIRKCLPKHENCSGGCKSRRASSIVNTSSNPPT